MEQTDVQVRYFSSPYISFHRAAGAYRWCLRRMGHVVHNRDTDGDVIILHGEPQDFPGVLQVRRPPAGRPIVGYVAWEHAVLGAEQRQGLALVDEVWVPSRFCRDRLAPYHDNIHVVPHVVAPPLAHAEAGAWLREQLDDPPGTFHFYAITRPDDPRKNLAATLAAFARLTSDRPLRLIVKAAPGFSLPGVPPPGVRVFEGVWNNDRLNALHHLGRVFVNSHRAEGWGLGITEAMALGRIAIATGHGGNMDYMTAANAFPLMWRPVPVPAEVLPAPEFSASDISGQTWAEVDSDALVRAMQAAVDRWDELKTMREAAAATMLAYAPPRIAGVLQQRLEALAPGAV